MKIFPKIFPKFKLIYRHPLSLVYLKLILATLIWGGTFIAGRVAVQDMGVFSIAFLRFAIATLLLFGISTHRGQAIPKLTPQEWIGIVFLGLTGILAYNAFFLGGLKLLPASRASLIVALNPIAIALSSALIFRKSLPNGLASCRPWFPPTASTACCKSPELRPQASHRFCASGAEAHDRPGKYSQTHR